MAAKGRRRLANPFEFGWWITVADLEARGRPRENSSTIREKLSAKSAKNSSAYHPGWKTTCLDGFANLLSEMITSLCSSKVSNTRQPQTSFANHSGLALLLNAALGTVGSLMSEYRDRSSCFTELTGWEARPYAACEQQLQGSSRHGHWMGDELVQ